MIASGAGGLLLVAALMSAGVQRPLPLGALAAYGLARIAIAANMMDLPGEAPTAAGRNHGLLALVAFLGLAVAAIPISDSLARVASSGLSGFLAAAAIAVPVTAVLMVATRSSPSLRRRIRHVRAPLLHGRVRLALPRGNLARPERRGRWSVGPAGGLRLRSSSRNKHGDMGPVRQYRTRDAAWLEAEFIQG